MNRAGCCSAWQYRAYQNRIGHKTAWLCRAMAEQNQAGPGSAEQGRGGDIILLGGITTFINV